MLSLFHDKKCCNCINLFSYILWDFIVLGLVLNWWKFKHEMKISVVLQLSRKKFMSKGSHEKAMWEAHAKSWRVKCQAAFRKTSHLARYPQNFLPSSWRVTERFFAEFFSFLFNNTSWCYPMFSSLFPHSLCFTFIVYCSCLYTRVVLVYCASFTLVPQLDKLD